MGSAGFLSDFPPVPTEDWERAIRASVAGPDYPEKLVSSLEEGLSVRPYYRAEDIRNLEFLGAAPGEFPYVRGTRGWRIREEIDAAEPAKAHRVALDAVRAGAEEVAFNGFAISSQAELALLLADFAKVAVRFRALNDRSQLILNNWLCEHCSDHRQVSADVDPLANLDLSASLCCHEPVLRLLTISAEEYEEMGLGAIEQVAIVVSAAVEFLQEMLDRGGSTEAATRALVFSFAIGPRFYVEIAKLRALRLIWARVVETFGGDVESARATVYARTAHWNHTVYDPHVNITRATTEAMSAVLGGADSIAVTPFDQCYRDPDNASRRLARNVQLILKHEAGFSRVADPLGGAYLIEILTNDIAAKAWHMFQKLEAAGGYRKAKAERIIESVVERRKADRQEAMNHRKLVLTGTNRFANPSETALERIEADPVQRNRRPASPFEELRLRTERAVRKGKLPGILLAQFGDVKVRGARVQFVVDFLACGGLSADVSVCESPEEVAKANAGLVVLCSSDPEYLPFADRLMQRLKQSSAGVNVAVAGNPSSAEDLKRIGITEFIHLRSNAVEVLRRVQQRLGVED